MSDELKKTRFRVDDKDGRSKLFEFVKDRILFSVMDRNEVIFEDSECMHSSDYLLRKFLSIGEGGYWEEFIESENKWMRSKR